MYKYQKQTQQQDIGFFLMSLFFVIVFWFVFSVLDTAHASDYTVEQIVNAIRKAEGNPNYGIVSVKCSTSAECRKICFNTVKNNRKRFADYGHKNHADFISFLASRYCPIGAENDPKGLNRHWEKNVRFFLKKDKT